MAQVKSAAEIQEEALKLRIYQGLQKRRKCGLCEQEFYVPSLPGAITYKSVLELQEKWRNENSNNCNNNSTMSMSTNNNNNSNYYKVGAVCQRGAYYQKYVQRQQQLQSQSLQQQMELNSFNDAEVATPKVEAGAVSTADGGSGTDEAMSTTKNASGSGISRSKKDKTVVDRLYKIKYAPGVDPNHPSPSTLYQRVELCVFCMQFFDVEEFDKGTGMGRSLSTGNGWNNKNSTNSNTNNRCINANNM